MYLEGLQDPPAFVAAAGKALDRRVPIVVVKAGVSEAGAIVAATHTSSLAGDEAIYDALFERLGVVRAASMPALIETLKALTTTGPLGGRRLAVLTCSGGESALAADAASAAGFVLPPPSPGAREAIARELPWYAAVSNPLDFTTALWGLEQPLTRVFSALAGDGHDGVLLVLDPPPPGFAHGAEVDAAIRAGRAAASAAHLPFAVASTLPEAWRPDRVRELAADGAAALAGVPEAFSAWGACARWGERLGRREPPPHAGPAGTPAGSLLDEAASKALLAAAGVRLPAGELVAVGEAGRAAGRIGFPVAAKLVSAELPHKGAAGALRLGLRTAAEVDAAVDEMVAAVAPVVCRGVLVEQMVAGAVAEVLVGVKRDPVFGPVLVVGTGGSDVELIADIVPLLPPVTTAAIERAITRLRCHARLRDGGADIGSLVETIASVAAFAEARATTLVELDVNPLLALPTGCIAVDALIALTR